MRCTESEAYSSLLVPITISLRLILLQCKPYLSGLQTNLIRVGNATSDIASRLDQFL